ncbi:MAG: PPOX class F420-dependent oxidoreductase [Chloroflexi bacterium]|nr:PPOX class F420-dependent oxidoreductase [Chloroflexota bacterium]
MAFDNLHDHYYMSLTTFRRSGEGVPTAVWFAPVGNTLYVVTGVISGKVKRIRHTPQVTVAPCTREGEVLGPAEPAVARLISDAAEAAAADAALDGKYGELKRRIQADTSDLERVFLAITSAD